MRTLANRVLNLQPAWTHTNTPEMQERGLIIRNEIPSWLAQFRDRLKSAMGRTGDDFAIEGRDGTGRKTEIPWVRFFSEGRSPHATEGWYCVYLFDAPGESFYLGLAHGSTRFIDGEFKPRSDEELQQLVSWANGLLNNDLTKIPHVVSTIQLGGKTKLSPAYARSTVAAIRYKRDHLPSEEQFIQDAERFAVLLGKLYEAQDLGRAPEAPNPEVAAAIQAISQVANPLKKRGQGFGLSAAERKAVECHAMNRASQHLKSLGFKTKDVSSTESYDILATKPGQSDLFVEVKGTTSGPDSVVLTIAEVTLNQREYPHTALIVVHGITLRRSTNPPTATDGNLLMIHPWKVEDTALSALSFRYSVPANEGQAASDLQHSESSSPISAVSEEPTSV